MAKGRSRGLRLGVGHVARRSGSRRGPVHPLGALAAETGSDAEVTLDASPKSGTPGVIASFTIKSGTVVRDHDESTGARPGRLLRGPQPAQAHP